MEAIKSPDSFAEKPEGFLITGIGASAGGIQALKVFFQHVSEDSGIAYVVRTRINLVNALIQPIEGEHS